MALSFCFRMLSLEYYSSVSFDNNKSFLHQLHNSISGAEIALQEVLGGDEDFLEDIPLNLLRIRELIQSHLSEIPEMDQEFTSGFFNQILSYLESLESHFLNEQSFLSFFKNPRSSEQSKQLEDLHDYLVPLGQKLEHLMRLHRQQVLEIQIRR